MSETVCADCKIELVGDEWANAGYNSHGGGFLCQRCLWSPRRPPKSPEPEPEPEPESPSRLISNRFWRLAGDALYAGQARSADPTPRPAHYAPLPRVKTRDELVREATALIDEAIKVGAEEQTRMEGVAAGLRATWREHKQAECAKHGVEFEETEP